MSASAWNPQPVVLPQVNANGLIKDQLTVATDGQRTFTLINFSVAPNTGSLWVFKNGDIVARNSGFIETDATTVILTDACKAGDVIYFLGVVGITGTAVTDAILRADLFGASGATNVRTTQTGVGAVIRSIFDKLKEFISAKDFGSLGDGSAADQTAVQYALNAGVIGNVITAADGVRISISPAFTAAGVLKYENFTWPQDKIIKFHGPNREQVTKLNNFSAPYQVIPGFTAAVPVNEIDYTSDYHTAIVLNVNTPASYNNVPQAAHNFQTALAAAGATFNSSQQSSIVWRKDGANRWQLVAGENATENMALHKFMPSQKLYRMQWDATTGDTSIQKSTASYPLDVAGAAMLSTDVSAASTHQADNRARFTRPSYYLQFKNDTVTNKASLQLEGTTGYQLGLNAPVTAGVDSAVSLSAAKGDGTVVQILLEGFYQSLNFVTDNVNSIGRAAKRISQLFAGTATINTSDERLKTSIQGIDAAVLRAWAKVEYCQFKFIDAVEKKGLDGARWHVGVIAQRVKEAFESEGVDPFAYGILCHDTWEEYTDADGNVTPAGDRYGVRYEEALVLECSYLRSLIIK